MGHGILSSPGLALGQALSGKQEGTHSGKARSPANAKAAQQAGPAGRQVLLGSVEVRHAGGCTRVSLDYHFRGLTTSLPLPLDGQSSVKPLFPLGSRSLSLDEGRRGKSAVAS